MVTQRKTNENIIEYHACTDCKHALILPHDIYGSDELVCLERHKDANHSGGLTKCPHFINK